MCRSRAGWTLGGIGASAPPRAERRENWTVAGTVPDPAQPAGDLPVVSFLTRRAWERWLGANHTSSSGIWMQIAKKQGGARSVSYDEAVEVAVCFGWIDGQKAPLDDQTWLQTRTCLTTHASGRDCKQPAAARGAAVYLTWKRS